MNVETSLETGIRLFDDKEHEANSLKIIHNLIGIGVNVTSGAYLEDERNLVEEFYNAPLKTIAPVWEHLQDNVRVKVVSAHFNELSSWISEQ